MFNLGRYIYTLVFALLACLFLYPAQSAHAVCTVQTLSSTTTRTDFGPFCEGQRAKASQVKIDQSTGQPDFSDVDDILAGYRDLMPADDLVMMNPGAESQMDIRNFYLYTDNKTINAAEGPDTLADPDCNTNGPIDSGFLKAPFGAPSAQQTQPARMFNIDRDVVFTVHASTFAPLIQCGVESPDPVLETNPNFTVTVVDPVGGLNIPGFTYSSRNIYFMQSAKADFDFDGYQDVLLASGGPSPLFITYTAVDPEDPSKGVEIGSNSLLPNDSKSLQPMSPPVIGDFNGDTIWDVAWVTADTDLSGDTAYYIRFATVCPGFNTGVPLCDGRDRFEVVFNPLSARLIELDTYIDDSFTFNYPAVTLAAGNFSDNPNVSSGDELIAFYGRRGNKDQLKIEYYGFTSNFGSMNFGTYEENTVVYSAYGEGAQLDRLLNRDQAVIGWQSGGSCRLWVLVFIADQSNNPNFSILSTKTNCDVDFELLNGMAVGRFTGEVAETLEQQNPQIAMFRSQKVDCSGNCSGRPNMRTWIFGTNTNGTVESFQPIELSRFDQDGDTLLSSFTKENPNRGGSFLKAGDLQGRSLLLGEPSIARLPGLYQVDVIQAAPATHVDYIQLVDDPGPVVNNFSVIPSKYFTKFSSSVTDKTTATSTATSSVTYSFKEGVNFQAKCSVCLGGLSGATELEVSSQQLYSCNVADINTAFSSTSQEFSSSTGFQDTILFKMQRQNVYYYPVIGQFVCTDEDELYDCPDSEKEPLYYLVSAPDQIKSYNVSGSQAEFYQPLNKAGNIFTYPWTQSQLLDRFNTNNAMVLSDTINNSYFTDNMRQTKKIVWSQGQGDECTSGTSETYVLNEKTSFSAGTPGFADVGKSSGPSEGAALTVFFEIGLNTGNSNLYSETTEVTETTGIEINRTDSFRDPDLYSYRVDSYIFGQPFPDGLWQAPITVDADNPVNIDTSQSINLGFAVDPTDEVSGAWWKRSAAANDYKAFTDVGVNQPSFWIFDPQGLNKVVGTPSYCLKSESSSDKGDCMIVRPPATTPENISGDPFYKMNGLVVQVGDDPVGPQMATAAYGDTVHLTATIFNYSMRDFDPGSVIKVQFYRQRWDDDPVGDSILIDEVTTLPMPGFQTQGSTPNWKNVTTSFNTQDEEMLPFSEWQFWVVVWAEDIEGNVVQEVPGHGLDTTSFEPGREYESILDVPLQIVTIDQLSQEVQRSFTNNVGMLMQRFEVVPRTILQDSTEQGDATLAVSNVLFNDTEVTFNSVFELGDDGGEVTLNTDLEMIEMNLDDRAYIKADLWSLGSISTGVVFTVHEVHPDESNDIHDIEILPVIWQDDYDRVSFHYTPSLCGFRDLYLQAISQNTVNNVANTLTRVPVNVFCRPGETNVLGQLIGDDGEPVIEMTDDEIVDTGSGGTGGCALAETNQRREFPILMLVPLILVLFRMRQRSRQYI